MIIYIGSRQPEFNGIFSPINERKQYKIALRVMDFGAFVLPKTYMPVPVKSKTAFYSILLIVSFKLRGVPSSINSVLVTE
jgi:hypothetical protein